MKRIHHPGGSLTTSRELTDAVLLCAEARSLGNARYRVRSPARASPALQLRIRPSLQLRTILASSRKVAVTLHQIDAALPPASVLVSVNGHGQLPAVLVDPTDQNGRIAQGTWLADNLGGRTDGTTYAKVH